MNTFPFSRTFGAGTHELATTDLNVLVDTSAGAVNFILPSINDTMDFVLKQGYSSGAVGVFPMNITDISDNASVNNITITTKNSDKFSSNIPSVVINENSGSYYFKPSATNIWSIINSGTGGGSQYLPCIDVTYSQLTTLQSLNSLIQGQQYLLTDFQTIYDQPDYDNLGVAKPVVVTKTSVIEPIIAIALSSNTISKQVYSVSYPNDTIEYDISFTSTEIMNAPAKGRISLRIDDNNNRTDYDHRTVLFKRYDNGLGIFDSYKDNGNASSEFLTFNSADIIKDNYIGDFAIYYGSSYNQYFLLSNNVINYLNSQSVISNKFGNLFYNNNLYSENNITSMYGNVIGDLSYGNKVSNVFYENIIGSSFYDNNIIYAFYNQIGSNFYENQIDGCYSNVIQDNFYLNVIGDDFSYNIIKPNFNNNQIGNNFASNTLFVGFQNNTIGDDFNANSINGITFFSNDIQLDFSTNKIEVENMTNCSIASGFSGNSIIAGAVQQITTVSSFAENQMFCSSFTINSFSSSVSFNGIKVQTFSNNTINGAFTSNVIEVKTLDSNTLSGTFADNIFEGRTFSSNNFGTNFIFNQITSRNFTINTLGANCRYNFISNNNFNQNTIGDNLQYNVISSDFSTNTIVANFNSNFVKGVVDSQDFTLSTYVYQLPAYTKEIVSREDGSLRLIYIDNVDSQQIVNALS